MSTSAVISFHPSTRKRHGGVAFAEDTMVPPSRQMSKEERFQNMLRAHQALVDLVTKQKAISIDPFAKDCQERLETLGGWKGIIDFEGKMASSSSSDDLAVSQQFLLPNSKSRYPVTVLDNVLPAEMCQAFIGIHEKVGFARAKTLLQGLTEDMEDCEQLQKYVYEQSKNTSELVQIESRPFASFLWDLVGEYFPQEQNYVGQLNGTGRYRKCGIIPVFRFMRYKAGQGFKPHKDPQRIHSKNIIVVDDEEDEEEPGIYQSLFTIALYLNDPTEFEGGKLNFVRLHVNSSSERSYESQATVSPKVGRCVLFSHDELHEGGGVAAGTKYMCQCDVLYKRVDDLA